MDYPSRLSSLPSLHLSCKQLKELKKQIETYLTINKHMLETANKTIFKTSIIMQLMGVHKLYFL